MNSNPSPKSVDEYLADLNPKIRKILTELRNTIIQAGPEVEEYISYSIPAYKFHGKIIFFAAFKEHYGLYILPSILNAFTNELNDYETTNSAIKIPLDQRDPKKLVTDIVRYAIKRNMEQKIIRDNQKKEKKSKKWDPWD